MTELERVLKEMESQGICLDYFQIIDNGEIIGPIIDDVPTGIRGCNYTPIFSKTSQVGIELFIGMCKETFAGDSGLGKTSYKAEAVVRIKINNRVLTPRLGWKLDHPYGWDEEHKGWKVNYLRYGDNFTEGPNGPESSIAINGAWTRQVAKSCTTERETINRLHWLIKEAALMQWPEVEDPHLFDPLVGKHLIMEGV